jgi:hypothetical protein
MRFLVVVMAAAIALGSESWPSQPPPPLAGFSFSPLTSMQAGHDPAIDLDRLLEATEPDLVRLPVYWELVQPAPRDLDFDSVDSLLDVITRHNSTSSVRTRVVLTVGARNFLFPELHQPTWAGDRSQPRLDAVQSSAAYRAYFDATIDRYRASPILYAWQVENEPFDSVMNAYTADDAITDDQLAWEMEEVHRLDGRHRAVVTSYNALHPLLDMVQSFAPVLLPLVGGGSGHPNEALRLGDAFGLDLYVDGRSVPYRTSTSVALRTEWKAQTLTFWADRAHSMGKQMWVAEMQAEPWGDATGNFSPGDLVNEAFDYRQTPVDVVLLWGVETWLTDPAWMDAAVRSLGILRAG